MHTQIENTPYFDTMSFDILLKVLSYLPPEKIAYLAVVNKQFSQTLLPTPSTNLFWENKASHHFFHLVKKKQEKKEKEDTVSNWYQQFIAFYQQEYKEFPLQLSKLYSMAKEGDVSKDLNLDKIEHDGHASSLLSWAHNNKQQTILNRCFQNVVKEYQLEGEDGIPLLDVTKRCKKGKTIFHQAISYTQAHNTILEIIKQGADINTARNDGITPFTLAIAFGRLDQVKLLLAQEGIDVNKVGKAGVSPLSIAIICGQLHLVNVLLADKRTDVNIIDNDVLTALNRAISKGYIDVVKALFADKRTDIPNMPRPPLLSAVLSRQVPIIMFLLTQSINVNAEFSNGTTALTLAINEGYVDVVNALLLAEGIDVNLVGKDVYKEPSNDFVIQSSSTPLISAVRRKDSKIIRALLADERTNINQFLETGHTALHNVAHGFHKIKKEGFIDIAKILLAHPDINVNQISRDDYTPLGLAAWSGDHLLVQFFLQDKRFEINQTARDGSTALMLAIEQNRLEVIKVMLHCKHIDLNLARNDALTPFCMAADRAYETERFEIIRVLLADARIKFTLSSPEVSNLLFKACEKGALDVVKHLLKDNINPDTIMLLTDPLFIASQNGHFGVVEHLLQIETIDISVPFIGKMDALKKFAEKHCVSKAMDVLLNAKLKTGCKPDKMPILPIEIASVMRHPKIVQLFEEKMAKSELQSYAFKLV